MKLSLNRPRTRAFLDYASVDPAQVSAVTLCVMLSMDGQKQAVPALIIRMKDGRGIRIDFAQLVPMTISEMRPIRREHAFNVRRYVKA